ncbi:hypothetical protein [Chitinophaga flava]|uniref:CRISPR-associated protein Csh1 n=1 Tax=Chitinophaga flava TaxID=2259036 RepID=A0A365XZJ4_9BACT|nr:hypothetical protein [Chitinophaga flava]RBL91806.1 hypothetical protein DF182_04170 [Chitinophaga flava]
MINVLSGFIESLDPAFKSIGIKVKEGLHILLRIQQKDGRIFMDNNSLVQYAFTRKKDSTMEENKFIKESAALSRLSWCVDTNKCFDLPIKAIHSCSPYCVAIKRENLTGGEKYKSNTKTQVYERINAYFDKAIALVPSKEDQEYVKVFAQALDSEEKFNSWLNLVPLYDQVKDAEYVIFYLDVPREKYEQANNQYLTDKLFNTNEYNQLYEGILHGTSNFQNGYPTKKPFLTHQTASFDIANRISTQTARNLYDFQEIIGRGILPNPLPIFIHKDDLPDSPKGHLGKDAIALFKKNAEIKERVGFREIIEELYYKHDLQLHNYHLLYYDRGSIKDFGAVDNFQYYLRDEENNPWHIKDLFNSKSSNYIDNVFELQQAVLQPIFNNALITKTKARTYQYRYFEDIDPEYCKSDRTFLLVMEYRNAFYDYIYKSIKSSVTQQMFDSILRISILEDIRLDKIENGYDKEDRNIREKLNIWFSLSEKFNLSHNKSKETMANKLKEHQDFIKKLAKNEVHIESDDQYAFAAGQVIYQLLYRSRSQDKSHKLLDPFLRHVSASNLNKAIVKLLASYIHELFSSGFDRSIAAVTAHSTNTNIQDLMPSLVSGYFSENALFSTSREKNEN